LFFYSNHASMSTWTVSASSVAQKMLDSGTGLDWGVFPMSENELSTLVAFAQRSRNRRGAPGFIACRGKLEGQMGVIVYSFRDAASAAAFQMRRQIEAKPLRLEILDRVPNEVLEYHE
jgi:hypothetical protein